MIVFYHCGFIVHVKNEFVVRLIFLLSPHSFYKLSHSLIKVEKFLVVRVAKVYQNPGMNACYTVENGLSQVHFPLVFPGISDVLKLFISIDSFLEIESLFICAVFVFPYFLLVHCQDV